MPRKSRQKSVQVALATCLGLWSWAQTGHTDPIDLPTLALKPGLAVDSATSPPQSFAAPPWNELGVVTPLPLPRLELEPPLAGRIELSNQRALALRPNVSGAPGGPVAAFDWQAGRRSQHQDPTTVAYWDDPSGPWISPLSPLDPHDPPPPPSRAASGNAPPPTVVDDRSGWARWNASLWGVSTTVLGFDAAMVAAFTLLPTHVTGWSEPQFNGLKKNFSQGPRVDNDRFAFNYIAHPLAGSEYYLIARNRELTWWQGFAYSAAMSSIFELLIESAYEQASWQDLWITPVSGTVIGELRWQVKKSLENPSTGKPVGTLNKILYIVIDPFDAVYKL